MSGKKDIQKKSSENIEAIVKGIKGIDIAAIIEAEKKIIDIKRLNEIKGGPPVIFVTKEDILAAEVKAREEMKEIEAMDQPQKLKRINPESQVKLIAAEIELAKTKLKEGRRLERERMEKEREKMLEELKLMPKLPMPNFPFPGAYGYVLPSNLPYANMGMYSAPQFTYSYPTVTTAGSMPLTPLPGQQANFQPPMPSMLGANPIMGMQPPLGMIPYQGPILPTPYQHIQPVNPAMVPGSFFHQQRQNAPQQQQLQSPESGNTQVFSLNKE